MNNPSHNLSDEVLTRWIDGELTPEETAVVERQIAAAPELLREKQMAGNLGALLREYLPASLEPPSPEIFNRSVMEEIHSGVSATRVTPARVMPVSSRLRWMRNRWVGPVASAALVGVAFFIWNQHTSSRMEEGVAQTYAPDPRVTANAYYSESAEATIIDLRNLDAVPDDREIKGFDVADSVPAGPGEPLILYAASDSKRPVLALSRDTTGKPVVTVIH